MAHQLGEREGGKKGEVYEVEITSLKKPQEATAHELERGRAKNVCSQVIKSLKSKGLDPARC